MKTSIISVGLVALVCSGCAIGGGVSVYKKGTDTDGVVFIEKASVRPFITWGDAAQAIIKQRVSNTKNGNAIGQEGYSGETSASNVAPIVGASGELIGKAVKAFVAP